MPRPLRIEVAGGLYHVIVRGNERKAVFRDDGDREWYLARLAHYREKLGFRLLAYCLMDNHAHLAIETGNVPLSRIMAALQSSYTQYFNRRHDRVGHLFQGRYKAFLVEEDRYALALVRYIHENPVKARLVRRAEDYPWSSDRFYRRSRMPKWLDVDHVLRMLSRRRPAAVREYRRLMREPLEESYETAVTWGQAVKGEEAFADRMLQAAGEPAIVPRGLTVDRIARQAAELEGVPLREATGISRERRHSQVRLLTGWASREVARISIARVAKYFSRDPSTLARGIDRLEKRMEEDGGLRRTAHRLAAALRDQ